MQDPNFYVTPTLDRVSLWRRNEAWLARQMAAPASRLLLVWRGPVSYTHLTLPTTPYV